MDYQEKLRLAKEALDSGSYDKETIEYIFPELKESEDEKISKELISYLSDIIDNICSEEVISHDAKILGGKIRHWITWLEKQGEMKTQGNSALEIWKDMRLEVYQQASGNRHEPNYSDDSTKMFSLTDIDEIFEKVAEKQGEQKVTKFMTKSYITPNPEFFQWIYNRLVYQHHENPNMDYMLSLKERIKDMQEIVNVKTSDVLVKQKPTE